VITVHGFSPSGNCHKVRLLLEQLGRDYRWVEVDSALGGTRTPEFLARNPNGKVPTLDDDGFCLWESNAIIQYLAALKPETGYLPIDLKERMNAVKWQFWESNHWDPACAIFMFERVVKKIFNRGDADPAEIKRGEELMARLAPVLDGVLQKSRYVAGEKMTVADLSIAPSLVSAEQAQMPIGEYRAINRWIAEMRALPAWQKTAAMQTMPG